MTIAVPIILIDKKEFRILDNVYYLPDCDEIAIMNFLAWYLSLYQAGVRDNVPIKKLIIERIDENDEMIRETINYINKKLNVDHNPEFVYKITIQYENWFNDEVFVIMGFNTI